MVAFAVVITVTGSSVMAAQAVAAPLHPAQLPRADRPASPAFTSFFAYLTSTDVVRHRLVGDIVDAYERYDRSSQQGPSERPQRAKPRR